MKEIIKLLFPKEKYNIIYKTENDNTLLFYHPIFLFLYLKANLFNDYNLIELSKKNLGIDRVNNVNGFDKTIWEQEKYNILNEIVRKYKKRIL